MNVTTSIQGRLDDAPPVVIAVLVSLVRMLGAFAGTAISVGLTWALLGDNSDALVFVTTAMFFGFFTVIGGAIAAVRLWRRAFPDAHDRYLDLTPANRAATSISVVALCCGRRTLSSTCCSDCGGTKLAWWEMSRGFISVPGRA